MSLNVQLVLGVVGFMAIIGAIVWRAASAFDKAFPDAPRAASTGMPADGVPERRTTSG